METLRVHKREARKELIACNPRLITIPCLVGQGSIVPIFEKKNVISVLVPFYMLLLLCDVAAMVFDDQLMMSIMRKERMAYFPSKVTIE